MKKCYSVLIALGGLALVASVAGAAAANRPPDSVKVGTACVDNALAVSSPVASSSSTLPILYASSRHSNSQNGSLYSIDLTTVVATKIGDFGFVINGLAYDSDNNILYGVDGGFGVSINHLFRINIETGLATPIGPLGSINFWGLAYDPTRHQLFATDATSLYTVDSNTGHATLVGPLSPPTAAPQELTFDPFTNTLFLGTEGVVNNIDVNGLNIVDRDTAALTFLGTYKADGPPNLFNNVRAIEFDPVQRMLIGIDFGGPLLIIDSSTGAATALREIVTPNNGFFGMAFVTQSARGEIFKIETTGTEYCGDFDFTKFNPSNNVDLWVRLDSNTQLTVSLTSNFVGGTTFPMTGLFYLAKAKTASFVGGVLFADLSYATIQGTATFNKLGEVTKLTGTFIQKEVLRVGCFSSGTFKSVQKLN